MRNTANGIDQLLLNPSQQKTRFFLRAEALKRVAHLMLSFVRFFIILYALASTLDVKVKRRLLEKLGLAITNQLF